MKLEISTPDYNTIIIFLTEARDKAASASLTRLIVDINGILQRLRDGRTDEVKNVKLMEKEV